MGFYLGFSLVVSIVAYLASVRLGPPTPTLSFFSYFIFFFRKIFLRDTRAL